MHSTIHGSVSSIFAYLIFKVVSLKFTLSLYVLSWVLGMIPDLSGIAGYFRRVYHHFVLQKEYSENPYTHREDLVHKPLLWIIIFLLIAILNVFLNFLSWPYFFVALFVVIFHFVMDGIGETEGVTWFWPFSKKHYGLFIKADTEPKNWYWWYFHHPYFVAAEIVFFLLSLGVLWDVVKT